MKYPLLCLSLLSLLPVLSAAGCVSERPRPAVVIAGDRIFAPRAFLGHWIRSDRPRQELRFHLPPDAAMVVLRRPDPQEVGAETQFEFYDIRRIVEQPDGAVSFDVVPVPGSGSLSGRARTIFFRPGQITGDDGRPDRIFEIFPGESTVIEYRRAPE